MFFIFMFLNISQAEIKSIIPDEFKNTEIIESRTPASQMKKKSSANPYKLKRKNFQIEGFGEEHPKSQHNILQRK